MYGFAEENLGYRYYASDEIKYGKVGDVKLRAFDEVKKPSFDGRNVFSYETVYDHENAVRLRCNGITECPRLRQKSFCRWIYSYPKRIPNRFLSAK